MTRRARFVGPLPEHPDVGTISRDEVLTHCASVPPGITLLRIAAPGHPYSFDGLYADVGASFVRCHRCHAEWRMWHVVGYKPRPWQCGPCDHCDHFWYIDDTGAQRTYVQGPWHQLPDDKLLALLASLHDSLQWQSAHAIAEAEYRGLLPTSMDADTWRVAWDRALSRPGFAEEHVDGYPTTLLGLWVALLGLWVALRPELVELENTTART